MVSAEVVVVSVGVVTSMEVVVVSSEFEMSELLAQLADSSETRVSRQKTIRLRADGRLIVIKLSCDFAAVLRWLFRDVSVSKVFISVKALRLI